jgi:hypothetical protein
MPHLLFCIARRNLFRVSQYAAALIVVPRGRNSTNKIPCLSQNTVHMVFLVDIVHLATDFYEQDVQNCVPPYVKCLDVGGDYVEK